MHSDGGGRADRAAQQGPEVSSGGRAGTPVYFASLALGRIFSTSP